MLNYPKVGRRPLQSDYRVSSSEIESYKRAKNKYEEEKRKRAEKNSNSSCLLSIVIIVVIAIVILTLISNANNSHLSDGQAFIYVILIALCICPFILGHVSKFSEAAVDVATDNPYLGYSPNQVATKRFQEELEKYEKITGELKSRYPHIESVDYDEKRYTDFVINELVNAIEIKFRFRNIVWWKNQTLNFKIAVSRVLNADGYLHVKNLTNLRDPVEAAFSKSVDISADKDGLNYFFRCFSKTNGVLEIKHIEAIQLAVPNSESSRIVVVTNYSPQEISSEVKTYIEDNKIELWDVITLVNLTKKHFVNEEDDNYPLNLPTGFKKCMGFRLSNNLNDSLLTTQPYFYYIYTKELFNSAKEALEAMQKFPKDKVYYGLCEYPNIKFYLYDDTNKDKPEAVYVKDEKQTKTVYAIIASAADNNHNWRIRVESECLFDADKREFIHNKHTLYTWANSTYIPFYLEDEKWGKRSWEK